MLITFNRGYWWEQNIKEKVFCEKNVFHIWNEVEFLFDVASNPGTSTSSSSSVFQPSLSICAASNVLFLSCRNWCLRSWECCRIERKLLTLSELTPPKSVLNSFSCSFVSFHKMNERKTLFIFEFKMNVLTFSAIFCPALIAGFSKIGRFWVTILPYCDFNSSYYC